MRGKIWTFCILIFLLIGTWGFSQVRNSNFGSRGAKVPYFTQETVENYRKAGWKCPDADNWPDWWWGLIGSNGTVEFPTSGGVQADSYVKLSGEGVYLTGYHGYVLEERNYVYTIWTRGRGQLRFHVISYGKDDEGRALQLVKPGEAAEDMVVEVNSDKWIRYRHLLVKTPLLWNVHPWVGVEKGALNIDEVDILPSNPALDLIVKEEEALYGTGALIEDNDVVKADEVFAERRKSYREALDAFLQARGTMDSTLVESMNAEMKTLAPYVLTEELSVVRVPYYNEMIVLTQVLNTLAGRKVEPPERIKATEAGTTIDYVPGKRKIKEDAVFVTAIEPDRILYEEGENATVKVSVKNTKATEQKVALIALHHKDLDTVNEVGRENVSIPAGGQQNWTVSYNAGPETYGRAIEVKVMDESGKEMDSWQEYYQVAKEWFRVQMHSGGRYNNMQHFFSAVPTSWGIHTTDAELIIGEQGGTPISPRGIRDMTKMWQAKGKKVTFYQNCHFSGIMGYEEVREHPEYALYDPNGQFAVDPVYGGYPDPMVLASPIEAGPKRQVKKTYLDRKYTSWQHVPSNFGMADNIEYGATCIREYAKQQGFDGVFIDGTITALKGYGYDGRINVPGDREETARSNASMQDIYYRILKGENPCFGTWYNHSFRWPPIARLTDSYQLLGSGTEGDVSDDWIREVFSRPNVSCLMEMSVPFHSGGYEGLDRRPKEFMEVLCGNRDYIVQRYGGNAIIGYVYPPIPTDTDKPGLSKWGWPTVNYYMALVTSAQHHIVIADSWHSADPALQFQTRYSRFLWAPDIKAVNEPEKDVNVESPEEIWWKKFVYRRDTANGYDLIIHLVRIPPTKDRWDINWVDEAVPLAGVHVSAEIGSGKIQDVYALRPYHFEEEQQVVENKLAPAVMAGRVTVEIPPFRYHTMVVIRVTGNVK